MGIFDQDKKQLMRETTEVRRFIGVLKRRGLSRDQAQKIFDESAGKQKLRLPHNFDRYWAELEKAEKRSAVVKEGTVMG
ncbi:MAG: hypothetical protein U9Q71_02045 [Pseudomonadota bacterium]|nr:hypothetical protein [Pseudomonadota bacterium]